MENFINHGFDTEMATAAVDSLIQHIKDNPRDEFVAEDFRNQWEEDYGLDLKEDFDAEVRDVVLEFVNTSSVPDFLARFWALVDAHPLQIMIREILHRRFASPDRRMTHQEKQALEILQDAFVLEWKKTDIGKLWKSIVYKRSMLKSVMFFHDKILKTPEKAMPRFFRDPEHPDHDYTTFKREIREEESEKERDKGRDDKHRHRDTRGSYGDKYRPRRYQHKSRDRKTQESRDRDRF